MAKSHRQASCLRVERRVQFCFGLKAGQLTALSHGKVLQLGPRHTAAGAVAHKSIGSQDDFVFSDGGIVVGGEFHQHLGVGSVDDVVEAPAKLELSKVFRYSAFATVVGLTSVPCGPVDGAASRKSACGLR